MVLIMHASNDSWESINFMVDNGKAIKARSKPRMKLAPKNVVKRTVTSVAKLFTIQTSNINIHGILPKGQAFFSFSWQLSVMVGRDS